MKIQQLLYIDDDPDDYEIFADAMKDVLPDTLIHWLATCTDLYTFLDTHKMDTVFLDLHLPKISGKECLSIIRSHPRYCDVPVVFYSGSNVHEFEKLDAGENTYFISKADTFTELKDLLQHFFSEAIAEEHKE
jgi:CheY-like chemotaxis protein